MKIKGRFVPELPSFTWGLATEIWGIWVGVAAEWARPDAPVYIWKATDAENITEGENGWEKTEHKVSYWRTPLEALKELVDEEVKFTLQQPDWRIAYERSKRMRNDPWRAIQNARFICAEYV